MVKLLIPKPKKKTTYPAWVFDNSPIADPFGYGERAVKWLRRLTHPKAPDKPFQLDRWQERIVRAIYGPRHSDGTRIVKTVVLLLPRGNRKTTLAAALALLHTFGPERVNGGEVLTAASDRSQARIAFEEAGGIIRSDMELAARARITDHKHRITNNKYGTFYACLSSDGASAHGHTPVFALVDEIHAWKKRDLYDAIDTGLKKISGSLMIIATTAGRGQENLAYREIDYARKVARGDVIDPTWLPVLFETDQDADWSDEAVWRKANPGLSCTPPYPDIVGLRQAARKAKESPADREPFRQYHLNVWLDSSADPFVDMSIYDEGDMPVELDRLGEIPCWIAVDMSTTTDLTAVVAAFRMQDDMFAVHAHFFCPEENLRARSERDRVPYAQWAEEGFITPTPGNVIDYAAVANYIRDLYGRFAVRQIGFDKAYAQPVMAPLVAAGLPVLTMYQGWQTQSPALNTLERAIIGRNLIHGGNPVLRWCFDNVAVVTDGNENRIMHKTKSTGRIDGAVATWMAVSLAASGLDNRSIYEIEGRGLDIW